jgi:hypothetical protein
MPWLDLLAEDDLQVVRVLLLDDRCDLVIEGIELLLAEGAHVIKNYFLLATAIGYTESHIHNSRVWLTPRLLERACPANLGARAISNYVELPVDFGGLLRALES